MLVPIESEEEVNEEVKSVNGADNNDSLSCTSDSSIKKRFTNSEILIVPLRKKRKNDKK
jgi:hypothetical protein